VISFLLFWFVWTLGSSTFPSCLLDSLSDKEKRTWRPLQSRTSRTRSVILSLCVCHSFSCPRVLNRQNNTRTIALYYAFDTVLLYYFRVFLGCTFCLSRGKFSHRPHNNFLSSSSCWRTSTHVLYFLLSFLVSHFSFSLVSFCSQTVAVGVVSFTSSFQPSLFYTKWESCTIQRQRTKGRETDGTDESKWAVCVDIIHEVTSHWVERYLWKEVQ